MKKPASPLTSFENIQAFLDDSRGQITIGEIPPIRSAALAAEGKNVRVAMVRRDDETVSELLLRLDAALGKAFAKNTTIDELCSRRSSAAARGNTLYGDVLCELSKALIKYESILKCISDVVNRRLQCLRAVSRSVRSSRRRRLEILVLDPQWVAVGADSDWVTPNVTEPFKNRTIEEMVSAMMPMRGGGQNEIRFEAIVTAFSKNLAIKSHERWAAVVGELPPQKIRVRMGAMEFALVFQPAQT